MKTKIKQISTVQMGYSFRTGLENVGSGSVAVIQMKDLLPDNTVDCQELAKIDMDNVKDHHLARKGDLVFRSRGQNTTSAILQIDTRKAIVAAPLLRIRIERPDIILPEYLNWYISQSEAQAFLISRAKGSAQKMISKQALEEMEVFIPDIQKQNSIIELADLSKQESLLLKIIAKKRKYYISTVLMKSAKGA